MVIIVIFTVIVFYFVQFFDQMQEEPNKIITSPAIPKEKDPEPEHEEPPVSLSDPLGFTGGPTLIQMKDSGFSKTQKVLGDGLIQITLKIPKGATWIYTIQI